MMAAQQAQILQNCCTAVGPMDNVVHLQPSGAVAARELAVPIALADHALQPRRHLAGGAADSDLLAMEHGLQAAVAGQVFADGPARSDARPHLPGPGRAVAEE